MSERDEYPAGVPCWVENASPDPQRAIDFYGRIFGWDFEGSGPRAGGEYLVARSEGRDVAGVLAQPEQMPAAAWTTHVRVDSADDAASRAVAAGGEVIVDPFDASPAGRGAVIADLEAATFCVWEAGSREGAQRINEPGAWSMSMLNSRDPERATSFYGELFGWEPEPFAMGGGEVTVWRRPGYLGGEPSQPVPRDVVAVLSPLGPEMPADVAPHWSVDFWVDDAEAAAARAVEAGGAVVAGPFESPLFKTAVIADPHGATLSISQLIASG
jgi:predicted enzyme related to lactoylglutathione lyase